MENLENLDAERYNALVRQESADNVLLIKFGSDWCQPCRALEKELEKLPAELGVKVIRINTDNNSFLTDKMEIMSIPVIILYYKAERKDMIIGCIMADELQKRIEKAKSMD